MKTLIPILIRDVLLLIILADVGKVLFGLLVARGDAINGTAGFVAVALFYLAVLSLGFCIIGVLAEPPRFKHLLQVAVAAWVLSMLNIPWLNLNLLGGSLLAIIPILLAMGIGGGISYLF